MMDPPKVMLEVSFLRAVLDEGDPFHAAAAAEYARLVDEYQAERLLLVAVSTHLRPLEIPARRPAADSLAQHVRWFLVRSRRGPFAPVDAVHVGWQHRRVARRARGVDDPEVAMTLVMCERHHIRRLATFDDTFQQYELELLPAARVAG